MQLVLRLINQTLCKFFVRKNTAAATPRHSIFSMQDFLPSGNFLSNTFCAWRLSSHCDATFRALSQMFVPFMCGITPCGAALTYQSFPLSIGCQMEKPTT
jgi:hypothetical protein